MGRKPKAKIEGAPAGGSPVVSEETVEAPKKKSKGGSNPYAQSVRATFGGIESGANSFRLSTGITMLDIALNTGEPGPGLTGGRVVEIYSLENAGKTKFALHVCGRALRENSKTIVIYYDAEARISRSHALKEGVDFNDNNCFLVTTQTLEQCFGHMFHIMGTYLEEGEDHPLIFVIDSLGMLDTKATVEAMAKDDDPKNTAGMTRAKLLTNYISAAHWKWIKGKNVYVIILNHLTVPIPMGWAPPGKVEPPKTPGGKAIKFLASQRIELIKDPGSKDNRKKESGSEDAAENRWGYFLQMRIRKNTMDADNRTIDIPVSYKKGFMDINSVVNFIFSDTAKKECRDFWWVKSDGTVVLGDKTYTKAQLRDEMQDLESRQQVNEHVQKAYRRMCNG